jgi:hypothetical protein
MRFTVSIVLLWIAVLGELDNGLRGPSGFVKAELTTTFNIENSMPRGNVRGISFQSRLTLPYGPDLYQRDPPQSADDQPYQGYGVAMFAAEKIVYDHRNHFLYSMSDLGYVTVADYIDPKHPVLTKLSFAAQDTALGDIDICPDKGLLVLTMPDLGRVDVYRLVDRSKPEIERSPPRLIRSVDAGVDLKSVLFNHDCSVIAVGNEASAEKLQIGGVTVLLGDFSSKDGTIETKTISLDYNAWDDEYLLRRGLNMPITRNALLYWDLHSHMADELDFSEVLQSYQSAMFLTPEHLAWNSPDETELLVNMQDNNGILRINMTDFSPVSVAGYGLKDHGVVPIDLDDSDGSCNLKTYRSLFAMRNPDSVRAIQYNGKSYVVTANEDAGMKFGGLEDSISSHELFTVRGGGGGLSCACFDAAHRIHTHIHISMRFFPHACIVRSRVRVDRETRSL